jgi:hypothetical protein
VSGRFALWRHPRSVPYDRRTLTPPCCRPARRLRSGDEAAIQLLLDNGADIEEDNGADIAVKHLDDETALHLAASEGHEAVVRVAPLALRCVSELPGHLAAIPALRQRVTRKGDPKKAHFKI